MSTTALLRREDATLSLTPTEEALARKQDALDTAVSVGGVRNEHQQEVAVHAQAVISDLLRDVEKARKEIKAPILEYGKRIDAVAREFCAELTQENTRVSKLIGDYQSLMRAKARAEEIQRQKEADALERERAAAMAKAKSHEELDAINEKHDMKAAELEKPAVVVPLVQGQTVRSDWEITVTNPHELARCHPQAVKITPLLLEISGQDHAAALGDQSHAQRWHRGGGDHGKAGLQFKHEEERMTVNEFNAKHHVGSVIKYQRPGMTDFVMTMTDSEAFTDQHRQAVVRVVMRNAPVRLSELVLEEVTQ